MRPKEREAEKKKESQNPDLGTMCTAHTAECLTFKKIAKVSFFLQCSKMQLIPLKKFKFQTCFFQFLCVLIEISMEIGMLNFLSAIIGHCTQGRISL